MDFKPFTMERKRLAVIFMAMPVGVAIMMACGGRAVKAQSGTDEATATTVKAAEKPQAGQPVSYTYKVVNTYPHDTDSYTQGMYWHEGSLWEGTGEYGNSKLQQVELETGRALKQTELPGKYFGEGIALLDGLIYQLTWREGEAFAYDAATFEKINTFRYLGEGWGLTTDGKRLYMSDGTNKIMVLDPKDFSVASTFEVRDGRRPVPLLNELEWIEGRIWANVYQSDEVVIIDPSTGQLTGRVDFTGLLPKADMLPGTDVLNGIAYDPASGRIFVTGKKWQKLFEIELIER